MYREWSAKQTLLTLLCILTLHAAVAGDVHDAKVYREHDLKELVSAPLAAPSYLIGKFIYLGLVQGKQMFATYRQLPADLISGSASGTRVAFGKVLISVRFDDDFPAGLVPGNAIVAREDDPLVLERVMAGPNDFLFVECRTKK
jgi:hypothetical protein